MQLLLRFSLIISAKYLSAEQALSCTSCSSPRNCTACCRSYTSSLVHLQREVLIHLPLLLAATLCICATCLQRSTCADKDVFKQGKQPQHCPPGTEADPAKANVSPPSRRRCCRVGAELVEHWFRVWLKGVTNLHLRDVFMSRHCPCCLAPLVQLHGRGSNLPCWLKAYPVLARRLSLRWCFCLCAEACITAAACVVNAGGPYLR